MLTYHPNADLYVAGNPETVSTAIDSDSQAYAYCEYLRTKFGAKKATDNDGDLYYIILVPEYRVDQIRTFVGLEYSMQYLMRKGL